MYVICSEGDSLFAKVWLLSDDRFEGSTDYLWCVPRRKLTGNQGFRPEQFKQY
jgi:hypothetical protein